MQSVRVSFWPEDNNTMSGVTLDFQVSGIPGTTDQWARDLAEAIAPVIPVEALGWTASARVNGITIQDDPRDLAPEESPE